MSGTSCCTAVREWLKAAMAAAVLIGVLSLKYCHMQLVDGIDRSHLRSRKTPNDPSSRNASDFDKCLHASIGLGIKTSATSMSTSDERRQDPRGPVAPLEFSDLDQ